MAIDYDNNREPLTYRIYPIERFRLPIQKPGHAAEEERGASSADRWRVCLPLCAIPFLRRRALIRFFPVHVILVF